MDTKQYINSGILELYVYGALTASETEEVSRVVSSNPEIKTEVEDIEKALLKLSSTVAPYHPKSIWASIAHKLFEKDTKVVDLASRNKTNVPAIIGWAASIALVGGLFYMINQNNALTEDLKYQKAQNALVTGKFEDTKNSLDETAQMLAVLRQKDIVRVELNGQAVAEDAYASVYWDTKTNSAYIDAKGLPEPPKGKVYQVWSLKLEPLTPTSIGLLDTIETDADGIFKLDNANASQAFGITLEPEGGSEGPTLEQLYVLGAVGS